MKKHLNKTVLITVAFLVALVVIYFIYRDYRPEINLLLHLNSHNQVILLHLIRSHGLSTMLLLLLLIAIFNAIPREKVEFMLIQLDRTDKVIVEYNSLEDMVEDGWCMGL